LSSLQLETDLTDWFAVGTFIAAIVFAAIYIPFFKWRETLTGKSVTVLILAIAGALLHAVLTYWHVIPNLKTEQQQTSGFHFFLWFSIVSLGFAGVAIIALTYETLRGIFSESENKWVCRLLRLGRKFPDDNK